MVRRRVIGVRWTLTPERRAGLLHLVIGERLIGHRHAHGGPA